MDDQPRSDESDREIAPSGRHAVDSGTDNLPNVAEYSIPDSVATFREMALSPETHAALEAAGYEKPTPVQSGVIPLALQGLDVMAQARTGTGKTASFVIPILERLKYGAEFHNPQALILVPTRELAVQVHDEVVKLSHGQKARCVAVYGGNPVRGQVAKLQKGAQVVVGTPGRVIDHIARGTLVLSDLRVAVLDEADRMLDIGFRPDIEKILRKCPSNRQTLLLSATVPPPIQRLSSRYMRNATQLNFSAKDISVETIEQRYFTVDPRRKFDLLVKLLEREKPEQVIIFCRTKKGTDKVYQRLAKKNKDVNCMHGDMEQKSRDRVMASFRAGNISCLVATDVVGRGIDVTGVSHIINYDIPEFSDDYVHRVGRTGRMGREGIAFTFVSPDEGAQLTRVEIRIDRLLVRDSIEGFDPCAAPEPPPQTPEQKAASTPPPPPFQRPGRGPKRYRRAL